MSASTEGPDWANLDPTFRKLVLRSRVGILFVAVVFGIISGLSILGFVYNLTIDYPGTERPVIVVDPLWMVGHVIRGLGLALLTYHLWRYQAAIKNWRGPRGEGTQQFIKTHAAAWNTGAIVLGVLLVYAIIYACVAFGIGYAAREPQWATVPYSSRRIELHRAELLPKEGLDEHLVERTGQTVYVKPTPDMTFEDIAEATVELPDKGEGLLRLTFNEMGQKKMDAISREHTDKPVALFLNGKLCSAPIVKSEFPHGFLITAFSRGEAQELVRAAKKKE